MLKATERQFQVTVVAKQGNRGLEYWVVLLNDQYDKNVQLLDSTGKFSIFHCPNLETTVGEATAWGKFLGVEVDLSAVESAKNTQAAQQEEKQHKLASSTAVSSFGASRKRRHPT